MRYLTVIVLAFAAALNAYGQNSKPRPLDGVLDDPTEANIIFATNMNETQDLGFSWVNVYCFGAALGCVVQNQPATSAWTTRISVFLVGEWRIAADCRDQTPVPMYAGDQSGIKFQLHPCKSGDGRAIIQMRKNQRSLTVAFEGEELVNNKKPEHSDDMPVLKRDDTAKGNQQKRKHWDRGASVYALEGAYNVKTKQVVGDGTVEQWELLFAELRMQKDLKTFQPQIAVKLIDQMNALREYNLLTSDRLEKLLEQDEQDNAVSAHTNPK